MCPVVDSVAFLCGMSKAQDKQAAQQRPISLPTLPKCDEQNRGKWVSEYDKVEAELLKSHLQGTATLGLRQLPSNWDRSIPGPMMDEDDLRRPRPRAQTTEPSHGSSSMLDSPTRGRRPRSAKAATNVSASLSATPLPQRNSADLLRVLFTILDPPVRFRSQIALDLRHIDLKWLRSYVSGDRTPNLQTIETIREDMLLTGSTDTALNSPRSVVVMFRNGVAVEDLQAQPASAFDAKDAEESAVMQQHHEQRRTALLASLREEYRDLSSNFPLFDLLDDMANMRDGQPSNATVLKRQGEKLRMAAYANKQRMVKQLEYERELHQKAAEADRRRKRQEQEIEEKKEAMRRELVQKHEQSVARVREQKQLAEDAAASQRAASLRRKQRLEAEERERSLHKSQSDQQRLAETQHKAALKAHRIAQNREALQRQQEQMEEDRQRKEETVEARRAKVERERAERREQQQAKQDAAARAREQAKNKAQSVAESIRIEAEEKTRRAEERLQAFQAYKAKQQQQHLLEESHRRQRQREAISQAERMRNARKQELIDRQRATSEHLDHVHADRARSAAEEHLHQQLQRDDKRFLVERQKRAMDFNKVMSIASITHKAERAEYISSQRQRMIAATRHEREQSRLERERLRENLSPRAL